MVSTIEIIIQQYRSKTTQFDVVKPPISNFHLEHMPIETLIQELIDVVHEIRSDQSLKIGVGSPEKHRNSVGRNRSCGAHIFQQSPREKTRKVRIRSAL